MKFKKSGKWETKDTDSKTKDAAVVEKKTEEEENTEEEKKKDEVVPVSAKELFQYADKVDGILITFGLLAAMVCGCAMPAMMILFSRLTNALVYEDMNEEDVELQIQQTLQAYLPKDESLLPWSNTSNFLTCDNLYGFNNWTIFEPDWSSLVSPLEKFQQFCIDFRDADFQAHVTEFGLGVIGIGLAEFVLGYMMVTFLSLAATRQGFRIKQLFLRATLRQNIAWFDTNQTGDFASRTTEDLMNIEDGIGEKIGMFVFFLTTFLASLINAFVHGWLLTLVMLTVFPVMAIVMGFLAKMGANYTKNELKSYADAGAVAEEVLSSIRTVFAFGGEHKEIERYNSALIVAKKAGIKKGFITSLGIGLMWLIMFSSYALAFWYGTKLVIQSRPPEGDGTYDAGIMVLVFFSIIMGSMNIGMAAPNVEAFNSARGAAGKIYKIINTIPPIDSSSDEGVKIQNVKGNIEFQKVHFNYPSRPDVKILQGINLIVKPGESVALVGGSGCGKSTCIQLIQRFYDPLEGQVKVDGVDLTELNVGWLRDHIGVVGQEPILFGTTISENIKYGKEGINDDEVKRAAKEANAHDFIMRLPKKYETLVGERGAQISGGQKQRIAIARALVRDPKILLLDEATSALDRQSESVVQEALEKAGQGRTTIIVAHRLTTIRNVDRICVVKDGVVVEEGKHQELMELGGVYNGLVNAQVQHAPDQLGTIAEEGEADIAARRKEFQQNRVVSVVSTDSYEMSEDIPLPALSRTSSLPRTRTRTISDTITATEKVNKEEEAAVKNVSTLRIWKLNIKEWPIIMMGVLGSATMGCSMPIFAILFGEVIGNMATESDEQTQESANFYCMIFVVVGVSCFLADFFKTFMFALAGERLTMRLRNLVFSTMLKQEVGYFDKEENSTGALCSRLSGDAASVKGATGSRVGTMLQAATTLIFSVSLAVYLNWKLGLALSPFVPVVLVSVFFQTKYFHGKGIKEDKKVEEANKIAVEAIGNIRTVASLHRENKICENYRSILLTSHKFRKRQSHIRGLVFGIAHCIPFFAWSVALWYGGKLVQEEGLTFAGLMKCVEAMLVGAFSSGQAVAFAPDYSKAMVAAVRIFKLLDRRPAIDKEGKVHNPLSSCSGRVEFKDVEFHYPTRNKVQVLRGLNDLTVHPGETIALVGQSGCGKSTCIQLLERFYDVTGGKVNLDDVDISDLDINWLRNQLGLVSQEPVLFNRTLGDNIAYGDNSKDVPMEKIVAAAQEANIHDFIKGLPKGYETPVGDKGTQLSGGQKQRVAIARALVRDPKILLLDEATSALDTESEKVVQEALDKASKGRTCITIAHRLSTIQNADRIFVIEFGKVREVGTHQELLAQGGIYYNLYTQNNPNT